MTDRLILDWPLMALSLFNTISLTWLGLTVLLNSDRRSWGIWLASGGLLMGGVFFVSHTAILGLGLDQLSWWSMIFWWSVGLVPAIALPFAWYVVMLWYAGFWEKASSSLRRRQRPWFFLTVLLLSVGLVSLIMGVVLLAVPSTNLAPLRSFIRSSVAGIPLLALGYSGYVILCIALSLDALRRPGPSRRIMGSLARRRAHPWLAAASLALLLVSLLVAGVVLWIVQDARQRTFLEIYAESAVIIALFDLFISLIIAVAIVLLGQAVVSYEVFTGKTLPRRGLSRHWRRAAILAAGYGAAVGGSVVSDLRPLYSLLLTTLLMTGFFALFSWRSYAERERYMAHLRPFVASQRLYDQLLTRSVPPEVDVVPPFRTLCAEVLGAQVAYLAAVGPLAPLVGPPLAFPESGSSLPPLAEVVAQFGPSQTVPIPLEPANYGGAVWAIPLWSERGLIGVFLLGKKRDGGLYAQEEIEIARVSGERLIDTQASVEMARRLMVLQRERLAQSQVIDQQTRRVLHDDILPDLQAAIIAFNNNDQNSPDRASNQAMNLLTGAHRQISDLLHEMPTVTAPEVVRLGLVRALRRSVDNELAHAFDEVTWQIEPEASGKVQTIPSLTVEVIFYAAREAVRNAAQHGRGVDLDRPFRLCVRVTWNHGLELQIEDNGVGLNATGRSDRGNGQGLALHSTMMAVVGGELVVESVPDKHTRVSLTLPEKDA